MPKIRRWHPVAHHFNRDVEVQELRRKFGDWMALVWIELLSIADQNEGRIPGSLDEVADSLAYVSLLSRLGHARATTRAALDFMVAHGWLRVGHSVDTSTHLFVVKYSEYHRSRVPIKIPTGSKLGSPPDPTEPDLLKRRSPSLVPPHTGGQKKGGPFPKDFGVSDSILILAVNNGWPDPAAELEAFRDYHVAKGSVFKDWQAAFRTWLRKGKTIKERGGGKSGGAKSVFSKLAEPLPK